MKDCPHSPFSPTGSRSNQSNTPEGANKLASNPNLFSDMTEQARQADHKIRAAKVDPSALRHESASEGIVPLHKPERIFPKHRTPPKQHVLNTVLGDDDVTAIILDIYGRTLADPSFFNMGEPSIRELLRPTELHAGPGTYMKAVQGYYEKNSDEKGDTYSKPLVRWIHLPANNGVWVELLMNRIYEERKAQQEGNEEAGPSYESKVTGASQKRVESILEADLLLAPDVWVRREYSGPTRNLRKDLRGKDTSPHKRSMIPLYSRISMNLEECPNKDKGNNFVIFMPYLHFERESQIAGREDNFPSTKRSAEHATLSMKKKNVKSGNREESDQSPIQDKRRKLQPTSKKDDDTLPFVNHNRKNVDEETNKPPMIKLHVRRTLDEAYYYTLDSEDMKVRNKDQVVYRYSRRACITDPYLIMVDQLWLWVIDNDTIVTSFPHGPLNNEAFSPYNEDEVSNVANWKTTKSDVRYRILEALSGKKTWETIKSVQDVAYLIIDKCTGVLSPCAGEFEEHHQFLEMFLLTIADIGCKQTKLFNKLCENSRKMEMLRKRRQEIIDSSLTRRLMRFHRKVDDSTTAGDPQPTPNERIADNAFLKLIKTASKSKIEEHMKEVVECLTGITDETQCLEEIKDVLDELKSMAYIFQKQKEVLDLLKYDVDSDDAMEFRTPNYAFCKLRRTVHMRAQEIEQMHIEAKGVYNDLRHLLDLKQKQASLYEANYARQEAEDTAQQGRSILVFTIITIIFLPLSFIAAIFSMNATEINGEGGRTLNDIFWIMFPTTLAVVLVSVSLSFSDTVKWFFVEITGILSLRQGVFRNRGDDLSVSEPSCPQLTETTESYSPGEVRATIIELRKEREDPDVYAERRDIDIERGEIK